MNRLWHAQHTTLHFTVFPIIPYRAALLSLLRVSMHRNLFTWSLNNGNLCHSQHFVIKKKTHFNESLASVIFHLCRHSIAEMPRNGIASSNIINF